jgi:hypothetical protein
MPELFSTVVAGVLVFVLGQIAIKFFIEPLQEYAKLKGEIAHALTYDRRGGAGEVEARLRNLGSRLRAMRYTIPWYALWAWLHIVPLANDLFAASSGLIGMSNSAELGTMQEQVHTVAKHLKIDDLAP